jgi:hypothetical protein
MIAIMGVLSQTASANLLRNPSFEQTPCTTPCNQDQAVMPSDWLSLNVTPDTYSNDGSYGLPPSGFGNFTGATAQDGIRWVAGCSCAGFEIFGQVLSAPLIPGQEYTLSAYLREAVRADLAHPGTYQIELWDSPNSSADKIVLGSFQPLIANQSAWELRTLTFTAPSGAATHPVLAFRPLGSAEGDAYPGIDNVVLVAFSSDDDEDGVPNDQDQCPHSDLSPTVVIDGCNSRVTNTLFATGCTISDLIAECAKGASNHDEFVTCVASLTNDLKKAGTITRQQQGAIQSCAGQANIP